MELIRLAAPNDNNGNPRRLFAVIRDGGISAVYDEGYSGPGAVPKRLRQRAKVCAMIETTPREYLSLLKGFGR